MTTPSPYQLTIGDIGVTDAWIVTPNGSAPLRGSQWLVRENVVVTSQIPSYAIVLAVVFAFFCLLGLLFLLIKEERMQGSVEVQVRSGNLFHMTQLPVWHPQQIATVRQTVSQAQSMALAAPQV